MPEEKKNASTEVMRAMARLMAETVSADEPARWQDASRLAAMGAAIAQIGATRVADFVHDGVAAAVEINVQGAGGIQMANPNYGFGFDAHQIGHAHQIHRRQANHADAGALQRDKMLGEGLVMSVASEAARAMAAKTEVEELKLLLDIRDRVGVDSGARKTVMDRMDFLIKAMEVRNGQSKQPKEDAVLGSPEHARGREVGEAPGGQDEPACVRADANGGAGHAEPAGPRYEQGAELGG
jgi:hypothetical protein